MHTNVKKKNSESHQFLSQYEFPWSSKVKYAEWNKRWWHNVDMFKKSRIPFAVSAMNSHSHHQVKHKMLNEIKDTTYAYVQKLRIFLQFPSQHEPQTLKTNMVSDIKHMFRIHNFFHIMNFLVIIKSKVKYFENRCKFIALSMSLKSKGTL